MNKKIIIIAAVCLAGLAAWFFAAKFRTPRIQHIVLISMDTTRADHFSCYGYPKNTTPNIDAFAEGATRFEHVVAPVPITLPSHSSMLTGLIPPAHGVHHNHNFQLADSNQTLAEILKQEGYHTAAIVSVFVLYKQFGLAQGFNTYDDAFYTEGNDKFDRERIGDETTRLALDWLEQNKTGKSLLFLHYFDPHLPYEPPEPFASQFPDSPYAGEIAFTDHCIGQVIRKLKELEMYDSTLLIITGDHGEMLGDHGEIEHGYFIYESAIKVPLIIKLPGQKKGAVIAQNVGLVDIVPTICSLLKIDPPSGLQGMDISPMLHGRIPEDYERFLYSESIGPTLIGASSLMAITHGQWKYIHAPRPELYNLEADPGEEDNLIEQEPHRARILEDKLRETLEQSVRKDPNSRIELDAESIKKLESLGYIAGKTDGELIFDQDKPDPKDLIHIYAKYNMARHLAVDREYEKAIKLFNEILPLRPAFSGLAHKELGDICLIRKDLDGAILHYRQAYEIAPSLCPYPLINDLAWIQATRPSLASRDVDEAVKYAMDACERTTFKDPSSLDTLAVCYAAAGDFPKAVENARRAWTLAKYSQDKQLAQDIYKRLKLFEQSKPYIEE